MNAEPNYRYLYGPVPSRRLGRSLGVDVVPHKVCSYDCVYCQLGRTTRLAHNPEHLISASAVMDELEQWLRHGGTADYISFAGSGEPTLNAELGEMIRAAKKMTDIPLAIITNGSLLGLPDVSEAVSMADVLLPSLDAGTERTFAAVNRPAPGVSFLDMREGLVRAAQDFAKDIWLEVMLVEGINDSDSELRAIREIARRICPDRLQVNTVERPSRSGDAGRVSDETLKRACSQLGTKAEIIVGSAVVDSHGQWQEVENELIRLLSRRPCTLRDIVVVSGRHAHEISKHLRRLVAGGFVEQTSETDPHYRCTTGGYDESDSSHRPADAGRAIK